MNGARIGPSSTSKATSASPSPSHSKVCFCSDVKENGMKWGWVGIGLLK
jgi:hypothetical protein